MIDGQIKEILNMSLEQITQKYSLEEIQEYITQLQGKAESYQTRLDLARKVFLEKYGRKPVIWIELADNEEEVQTALFIDGEINLFPVKTSVGDALTIGDFIGELLKIPDDRKICGGKMCSLKNVWRVPLTKAEGRIYIKQVLNWLQTEVKPKPQKIRFPYKTLTLQTNGEYK